MVENLDLAQLYNSNNLDHCLSLLTYHLPNMSPARMHRLCERQEKLVLTKIQEIKNMDIYE